MPIGRGCFVVSEDVGSVGIRNAELCALEVRDIDIAARTVHVRDGKGGKERYAQISGPVTSCF